MIKRITVAALAAATFAIAPLASAQTSTPSPTAAEPVSFVPRQAPSEWRASIVIGTPIRNTAGETLGNVNDVVVGADGQVTSVVIGVGGFLGLGEKNVAVPFKTVSLTKDAEDRRTGVLNVSKAALQAAPAYESEKTAFETVQDKAKDLAEQAKKKATEISNDLTAPKKTN